MSIIKTRLILPDVNPDSKPNSEQGFWTQRPSKNKGYYLAKRVSTDDLFGEAILNKPVNPVLGLAKIREGEEAEEQGRTSKVDESYELSDPEEPPHTNVFKADPFVSSKFKEHSKGPSYASTGHLIKHSIVGSVEMFERSQKAQKKFRMKESVASSERDNLSFMEKTPSRTFKPSASFADQSGSSTTRSFSQPGVISKKLNQAEKKKESNDVRVSKEELYSRIDEIRKNQSKFYEMEKEKYKNMTLGDQLHHSKEQRCLERFDNTTHYWNGIIDHINHKINRDAGKSIMLRSDEYREKKEEADAFQLIQTDSDRFGTTLWYMTLRRDGPEEPGTQRVLQDIPAGFNVPQIVRPPSSLEIIRRSTKATNTNSSLPNLSTSRYLDRTKREYVMEKSIKFDKYLKKIKPTHLDDIDEFFIEGKNKLDMEVNAFVKTTPNKETYMVPKKLFTRKRSDDQEFIVRNYDTKEIKKNGLCAYVK